MQLGEEGKKQHEQPLLNHFLLENYCYSIPEYDYELSIGNI